MSELEYIKQVLYTTREHDISGYLHWHFKENKELQFAIDCSDTFIWGCADAEDLTPDNFPDLLQALKDTYDENLQSSFWGTTLFACRMRKARPMKRFLDIVKDPSIVKLLEDCGPACVDY